MSAAPPETRATRRRPVAAAVLGVLGEVLLTAGAFLALFVVWQLWWTDVVGEREQAALVAGLDWAVTDLPDEPAPPGAPDPRRHDAAPVLAEPDAEGTTFATLWVPRWGADYVRPISQGTARPTVLDPLGIGHYVGTAMPGEVGNFAVAGHRATYGKPFNRVEELELGDALVVQTEQAWYVYRITGTQVVLPHQVEVIAPVPGRPGELPTRAMMTMTTCHPLYSARERFVVHAELDYWMPVDAGTPDELTGGA